MRVLATLAALSLATSLVTSVASAVPKPPEQVIREFVATLKSDAPADIAPMIHPDEIAALRARLDPVISKVLRKPEGREAFPQFVDPYNIKKMREMDDLEFCQTFIRWAYTRQPALIATIKEAEVKVLGDILDGGKSYVVARATAKIGEKENEFPLVFVVMFDGENPKIAMPPEILRTADMVAGNVGR